MYQWNPKRRGERKNSWRNNGLKRTNFGTRQKITNSRSSANPKKINSKKSKPRKIFKMLKTKSKRKKKSLKEPEKNGNSNDCRFLSETREAKKRGMAS